MLAVVVADVECAGEYTFERRRFGSSPEHLQGLAEWLLKQEVEEVVMESTAQYGQPVWGALERRWRRAARDEKGRVRCRESYIWRRRYPIAGGRGRKRDFPDAERLVKRLVAQELVLSFVPDPETATVEHGVPP